MGLVRCTCVVRVSARGAEVQLLDPTCDYVVHRLAAEMADVTSPESFGD